MYSIEYYILEIPSPINKPCLPEDVCVGCHFPTQNIHPDYWRLSGYTYVPLQRHQTFNNITILLI